MIKMRLIREAYMQVKEDDPGTALTLCALRRIVRENKVPVVKIGRKMLLNYDALLDYLNSQGTEAETQDRLQDAGTIRKVI